MRKIEFEVPVEIFGDFAEKLTETGLDNRVLGRNEENEVEIEILYEKDDAGLIDELEDHLNELKEQLAEGEEEQEEEDEDQD